jgi:ribonuclease Z
VLRITFLGTSSSRPTVRRNVSAIAVQREGDLFLFDCGEGTQRQMMKFGVGFAVREIFVTHLHADHYLGITGLLRTMSLQGREDELVIRGPEEGRETLCAAVELGGDRIHFPVTIRTLTPAGPARYEGYEIQAFQTDHTGASVGLRLAEDTRLGRFDVEKARDVGIPEGPLYGRLHRGEDVELEGGRRVRAADLVGPTRPGRTVVYTGDTRPCKATVEAATDADLLIHECTFSHDERGRALETRHSTAREAAEVAAQASVRSLILTHFSARFSEQPKRLVAEARAVFSRSRAAEDGMSVEVPFADSPDATDGKA